MKQTVDKFHARHADEDGVCVLYEYATDCGSPASLRLVRHNDGRLDVTDSHCDDSGADLRDSFATDLADEIDNWIRCIESGDPPEPDEEPPAIDMRDTLRATK